MKRASLIAIVLCSIGLLSALAQAQNTPPATAPAQAASTAQTAPPSTDIFIADLNIRDGRVKLGRPANVTHRDGYDNQPAFLPDGHSFLFTSVREGTLPDIYRYNLDDQSTTRVTATPEGEYSPTPIENGKAFTVIRVEADQTQRLWKFSASGGDPQLVLENLKPVGYHCWLDDHTVATFVLGQPPTLQIADVRTGKAEIIERNIGRSLRLQPGRNVLTFVHKVSDSEWLIKAMDLKTRKIETITKTLPGSEDFIWTPQGILLMASGSKLFKYDPKHDHEWQEAADFTDAGLKGITRLAVSPKGDKLALVAAMPPAK